METLLFIGHRINQNVTLQVCLKSCHKCGPFLNENCLCGYFFFFFFWRFLLIWIIWAWFMPTHSTSLFRLAVTSPSQGLTGHERWQVNFSWARTQGSELAGLLLFYSSWKLNVTGLLRAELSENYWTITSLRLQFASWLFNFVTLRWEVFQLSLLLHHLQRQPAIG